MYEPPRPALDTEGALRGRHERSVRDAMDVPAALTNAAGMDGEGVWSRSPDAEIKFVDADRQATVAKKPGHRGERAISRKPLRREGRCFGVPAAFSFACEPRVRWCIRCSLRPLLQEGHETRHSSGEMSRGDADACHCEERKRRSNPDYLGGGTVWIASLPPSLCELRRTSRSQ
jgi:hypothetical protein